MSVIAKSGALLLLVALGLVLLTAQHGSAAVAPAGAASSGRSSSSQTAVSLLAEPQAGPAPFLKLISGARSSIELTMYELYDRHVETALAAAARRGVDVRVLLNGGYYSEHETNNDPARRYLTAHGVHVRFAPSFFALTHQKTLTVDGRVSAVMTLNFDGLYASTRDYAILDRQGADVRAIVAAFDADWARREATAGTGSGDLVWSPGAEDTVLALIDGARRSIDIENEEMAYAPATDARCAAARRGVRVELVMTYASDWRDAFGQLGDCGVHIRLYHGQSYYIHAKLLAVDGARALVSSQNLSTTSLRDNRELGIELTNPAVVAQLIGDFRGDYTGAEPY